jgi:hypothetical protein
VGTYDPGHAAAGACRFNRDPRPSDHAGSRVAASERAGGLILGVVVLMRLMLHAIIYHKLHGRRPARLWLAPLREGLCFFVWLASYAGRGVVWRGNTFAIAPNGTLRLAVRRSASIAAGPGRQLIHTRSAGRSL